MISIIVVFKCSQKARGCHGGVNHRTGAAINIVSCIMKGHAAVRIGAADANLERSASEGVNENGALSVTAAPPPEYLALYLLPPVAGRLYLSFEGASLGATAAVTVGCNVVVT